MKTNFKLSIEQLYEEDFLLWLDETLKHLQNKEANHLDWEHLAEEIEALGNEQRHKVESYLKQLLKHLLLYQYWQSQWDYYHNGWQEEIRNFRDQLGLRLQSKTLYNYLLKRFDLVYQKARKLAIDKTGLSADTFPLNCSYTFQQILDEDFLPRPFWMN